MVVLLCSRFPLRGRALWEMSRCPEVSLQGRVGSALFPHAVMQQLCSARRCYLGQAALQDTDKLLPLTLSVRQNHFKVDFFFSLTLNSHYSDMYICIHKRACSYKKSKTNAEPCQDYTFHFPAYK